MPQFSSASQVVTALNEILGFSQEEIARAVGVSYTTVNAWANERSEPRPENRSRLEALLRRATAERPERDSERLRRAVAILTAHYGSPRLGNKSDPLDELFFILVSLKTSHRTYEDIYDALVEEFRPWKKLLDSDVEEVERVVRSGGLGSIKARSFVGIAGKLKEDFGDVSLDALREMETDRAEEYLRTLPGVGVKTARCVLMYSLDRDVTPVDTHTYRVGVRLGVIDHKSAASRAHGDFDEVVPEGLAYATHTNFVAHGREVCKDPTPDCPRCDLRHLCDYAEQREVAAPEVQVEDGSPTQQPRMTPERSEDAEDGPPIAVDIYSGCGGLSAGLEEAGFDVAYALDWDEHSCETYRANFGDAYMDRRDVREVSGREIEAGAGQDITMVAGGPNCQGVSERGRRDPDDPRNFMFPEFVRLVSELSPRIFMMENVPGLTHRHNFDLLRSIFDSFRNLGYRCAADVLLAADYGVPQLRYRFFLVGARGEVPLSFPAPTHHGGDTKELFDRPYVTVREAIGDLPSIDATRQEDSPLEYQHPPANDYQRYARRKSDAVRNHICSATEEINLRRIRHVPPGGNWKDIPEELLPNRFFKCRMTDHSTTYARLRWDQPSYTITSLFSNVTSGAFTHPEDDRALSVREGARLQSFTDDFRVRGPRNSQYRQIGNAVPPLMAGAVGGHLLKLLRGDKAAGVEPTITWELLNDDRGWDALPVLTPRFKPLFGTSTKRPDGWPDDVDVGEDYRLEDPERARELAGTLG